MTNLKIFVSSTCHDLKAVRSDLRDFIKNYGYEPVMSDFGDIHYDPEKNTHESCLEAIDGSDFVVFLVGSRFGSSAANLIVSKKNKTEEEKFFSITQEEVKRAQDRGIYIYTFIEKGVYHDYWVYTENKRMTRGIKYPSISNQKHSKYIFEFIDSINKKGVNNAIFEFNTPFDIKKNLTKQWGQLFKKLLVERNRYKTKDEFQKNLEQKLSDIRLAIIDTHGGTQEEKSKIHDFIYHRPLVAFCYTLNSNDYKNMLINKVSWRELLISLGVQEVRVDIESISRHFYFNMKKGENFRCNHSINYLNDIKNKWVEFNKIEGGDRLKIIESLTEKILRNSHTALTKCDGFFDGGDDVTDYFLNEEIKDGY